jgi:hypothetical protein
MKKENTFNGKVYIILSKKPGQDWKINLNDIGIIQPKYSKPALKYRDDDGNIYNRSNAYIHSELYFNGEEEAIRAMEDYKTFTHCKDMEFKVVESYLTKTIKW